MQEEGLQIGGQCGFVGFFFIKKIQDGEMLGLFIDYILEKSSNQVVKSDVGIVVKDFCQFFYERVEKYFVVILVYYQLFKLVDFCIVLVDFRGGGNVIGMVVVILDNVYFVSFMKDIMLIDVVVESEEFFVFVLVKFVDLFGCLGVGVEEFFDVVQFVYFVQLYIIVD